MFDFEDLDYYELLGVSRAASTEEIKRAYRREISKYHPDRFAGATPEQQAYAQRRSQAITEAYGVLSDFTARSSYNLGRPGQPRRTPRATPSSPATPAPPQQPRDHQAELYEQARAHLQAGRTVQAAGVLRQLQQINPFYRDSADLLARAEGDLRARQEPRRRGLPRPLALAAGALGSLAVIAVAMWAIGMRSTPTGATPIAVTTPGQTQAAAGGAPAPTPEPASEAPANTLAPTAAPPTEAPTNPPTAAPSAMPAPMPTAEQPTFANAAPTAPPLEQQGAALLTDDFSGQGWADTRGGSWSVGYADGRYRIAVDRGVGTIWSYRSVSTPDVTVAADVEVTTGAGGLMLRFVDASNYLTFVVEPQQTAYKLEQRSAGSVTVLAAGLNEAVRAGDGAQNRLTARISGSLVQIAVNGQQLAEVEATGAPASPRFGIVAVSGSSPAEAFFDNFQIRTVE
ncbi:MAG: hypothetical protein RLZZ387_5229 [Chloroflexota bacterium]